MRRLIVLAAVAGCASAGPPPGGPVDTSAPRIVDVAPDSGAINVRGRNVVYRFDDIISDRVARGGLEQYFLVSPRDGAPRVSWHRREIEVRPRRGFRDNTTYTVTKLPGLTDLRGNRDTTTSTIVFSTGPTIPTLGIVGRVFDWSAERPAPGAIVQAISRPDSTVYVAVADTSGGFTLGPFGPGTYTVLAFIDANRNMDLDRAEKWDSTRFNVSASRPFAQLLAIERDTIAPRLTNVDQADSAAIQLTFDRALDPDALPRLAQFRVVTSDSAVVPLGRLVTPEQERAREDSLSRARTDSVRRADSVRTGRAPTPVSGRVTAPPVRPPRPAPPSRLRLELAPGTRLQPGRSYRVTATDIRGLTGRTATSARVLTTRRAVSDSTARPAAPAARPPG